MFMLMNLQSCIEIFEGSEAIIIYQKRYTNHDKYVSLCIAVDTNQSISAT